MTTKWPPMCATMTLTEHLTAGSLSNMGHVLSCSLLANCTILLGNFYFYSIYLLFVGIHVPGHKVRGQRKTCGCQFFSVYVRDIKLKSAGWAGDVFTHRALCHTPSGSYLGHQFRTEYDDRTDKAVRPGASSVVKHFPCKLEDLCLDPLCVCTNPVGQHEDVIPALGRRVE